MARPSTRAGDRVVSRAVLATAVALATVLAPRAYADSDGRPRPPVTLVLDACLDADRDAIHHAVRVELGASAPPTDPSAVEVRIACIPDSFDAGVVIEVRPPDSARRYRYALDWRAQPADARPRLLGLAVAEAVDASQIELTALPEPPLDLGQPGRPPGTARDGSPVGPPRVSSGWDLAVVAGQRTFTAREGVRLLGLGVMPRRRMSSHLRLDVDLLGEADVVPVQSGTIDVLSISSAPRLVYRLGARLHADLGIGARVGAVRMRAKTIAGGVLNADSLVRVWAGPAATASLGLALTPSVALDIRFELGKVAVGGAIARDFSRVAAALDGAWTSFGVAAVIAL